MNSKIIESIANAVLYEGYMLYPYRPSSVKNQQRWNFGVVYPRLYSEMQKGTDICVMQTQCLVRGDETAELEIKIRFLQCISRKIGRLRAPVRSVAGVADADFQIVDAFRAGGKDLQSWQEASERDLNLLPLRMAELLHAPVGEMFAFPGGKELEPVLDDSGNVEALIVRSRDAIRGSVEVSAVPVGNGVFRLSVVLSNLTNIGNPMGTNREDVLLKSLLSAHTVLGVSGGEFISQIDPPPELQSDCLLYTSPSPRDCS